MVQQLRVHDRMRLERLVVRRLQPVPRQVSDHQAKQQRQDRLRDPGVRLRSAAKEYVGRFAEEVLRQKVVSAAQADERPFSMRCRIGCNVAAGVAAADDEDPLAGELARQPIIQRVIGFSGEVSGVRRIVGQPVVPHRRDDACITPELARRQHYLPSAPFVRRGARDVGLGLDVPGQPVCLGEPAYVGQNLAP